MTAGLLAVAAVLLVGTAVGLWRRRTDGRFRAAPATAPASSPEAAPGPPPVDPLPVADQAADLAADGSGGRIDPALLAALGADQPADATLLQFSSAFCAPCRAVRRVSSEVAAMVPGVRHVEVDAESHLDAVRALNIWRTPTLLVLDAGGREVKRASGVPTKPQLIAALGQVIER